MLIPQYVERVKVRLGTPEEQIAELRVAVGVEANDFAVQSALATPQIASEPFAQTREGPEDVAVARDKPHASLSECSNARNPSHLISNSEPAAENGSGRRLRGTRWKCGNGKPRYRTRSKYERREPRAVSVNVYLLIQHDGLVY